MATATKERKKSKSSPSAASHVDNVRYGDLRPENFQERLDAAVAEAGDRGVYPTDPEMISLIEISRIVGKPLTIDEFESAAASRTGRKEAAMVLAEEDAENEAIENLRSQVETLQSEADKIEGPLREDFDNLVAEKVMPLRDRASALTDEADNLAGDWESRRAAAKRRLLFDFDPAIDRKIQALRDSQPELKKDCHWQKMAIKELARWQAELGCLRERFERWAAGTDIRIELLQYGGGRLGLPAFVGGNLHSFVYVGQSRPVIDGSTSVRPSRDWESPRGVATQGVIEDPNETLVDEYRANLERFESETPALADIEVVMGAIDDRIVRVDEDIASLQASKLEA